MFPRILTAQLFAAQLFALACTAAGGMDVSFADRDGKPLDCEGCIETEITRRTDGLGIETIVVTAVSAAAEPLYASIVAKERVPGADTVWDGMDAHGKPKDILRSPLLCDGHFLMGAAWGGSSGVALALGAEDMLSFADLSVPPDPHGVALEVRVPAAFMKKGARFSCTFHRIAFSPKYGIRDALARFYRLYPARFRRDPRVNPALYGTSAQYASWQRCDPETCRFMDATWEWCYAAARTWGDILSREEPTGEQYGRYCWSNNNSYTGRDGRHHKVVFKDLANPEFTAIQDGKLANARYCGVANAFYMMALASISKAIGERHPDSLATHHVGDENGYPYSSDVFAFPECSWGRELRRQLAELVREKDVGGIAFDVSRPSSVYRGERLAEMENVGWDAFGAGVVRGIGSAKLFDYLHTLPNKTLSGNCGVVVNTKDTKGHHLSDILHMDTMMSELPPWSRDPPYPLNMRYQLGEKGLTVWEDYSPLSFASDFRRWPTEDKRALIRDLARYAVHRSLVACATLPCAYLTEYTGLMSHGLSAMGAAGWKPVIGAAVDGECWELARYGLGDESFIALCNETNAVRRARLTVWPDEIAAGIVAEGAEKRDAFIYVPFFGGMAEMECGETEHVCCDVGPLLANILEAAGTLRGSGRVSAEWSGDFDAVRLTLRSVDFSGEAILRDSFGSYAREGAAMVALAPGKTVVATYRNTVLPGFCGLVRAFPFADEDGKRPFRIEYAPDGASRDMAERMEHFFWRAMDAKAGQKRKAIMRNGRKPYVACREKADLPPRTVVLRSLVKGVKPISISAGDDESFSRLVRRVLDVINVERFPDYGPDCRMLDAERSFFPFRRL